MTPGSRYSKHNGWHPRQYGYGGGAEHVQDNRIRGGTGPRGGNAKCHQGWPITGGGVTANNDAKPYTQDQVATLLSFHGAMNVRYLSKIWRLFKSTKTPNYYYLRHAIKGKML